MLGVRADWNRMTLAIADSQLSPPGPARALLGPSENSPARNGSLATSSNLGMYLQIEKVRERSSAAASRCVVTIAFFGWAGPLLTSTERRFPPPTTSVERYI